MLASLLQCDMYSSSHWGQMCLEQYGATVLIMLAILEPLGANVLTEPLGANVLVACACASLCDNSRRGVHGTLVFLIRRCSRISGPRQGRHPPLDRWAEFAIKAAMDDANVGGTTTHIAWKSIHDMSDAELKTYESFINTLLAQHLRPGGPQADLALIMTPTIWDLLETCANVSDLREERERQAVLQRGDEAAPTCPATTGSSHSVEPGVGGATSSATSAPSRSTTS
jgi:hypothetical protein